MPGLPFGKRLRDKLKQKRILDPFSSHEAPPTSGAETSSAETEISKNQTSEPSSTAVTKSMVLNESLADAESSRAGPSRARPSGATASHEITPRSECPDTPPSQAAASLSSNANLATTSSQSPPPLIASPSAAIVESAQATPSVICDPTSLTASCQASPSLSSSTPAPRNLWTEALGKLPPKDQQAVRSLQPTANAQRLTSESIEELLGLTRDVQDDCKAKLYKFQFRGKDVILRDVAGKIISWLNKFKEIGDVAVNFDPVHASLPWAGVRFLLQAATAEHEMMGNLVVTTEKLSNLITRGAIYERLYQPGTITADVLGNLYHALAELYSVALQMMALCHRISVMNTAERVVHATVNPGGVSALLEKCEQREVQVEHEAHNCERTRSQKADASSKRLLELLREPILRTDAHVFSLLEYTEQRERLEILDWTSKVLYGSNHQTVKDERTPNTCEWLLDHSRYRKWKDASASIILWLCGTAGTGKTFLTSKVIDDIQVSLTSKPNQEAFAFFYCNRNEAGRREPLEVLKAFVRQLSTTVSDQNFIQKRLKAYYIESRRKASELTTKDCKDLLLEFINVYPRTTLILDALDECEKHKRRELIEILDRLLAEASNPLKIFVSSRPDGDITEKLKHRANIRINATDNQDDISRFVKSEIIQHRRWEKLNPKLQSQIVETLQEQSQGMFQWAYLQIKQLLDLQRSSDIVDRLGKLPTDLKNAYDEIYNGMSEVEKRIADRAFQWVMCAHKPLKTIELLPAVCQDENGDSLLPLNGLDEGLLLENCHNLLVIDPVRHVWVPSHLSVIEYFENHLWTQSQANCLVASVCLLLLQGTVFYDRERSWAVQQISIDNKEDWSSTNFWEDYLSNHSEEDPLLKEESGLDDLLLKEESGLDDPLSNQGFEMLSLYARQHWMIHAKNSNNACNHGRLPALLENFLGLPLDSSTAYRSWYRMFANKYTPFDILNFFVGLPQAISPASIASFSYCAFGLDIVLPNWHDYTWVKDDIRTDQGATYLELAASYGSISACRDLIKYGAEAHTLTESSYMSALAAAAYRGEKEVVEVLVKEGGAYVNMQLQHGIYGSALAAAAYMGRNGVVEFLVREGGADVNMQLQHGKYGSVLAAAVYMWRIEVVEFLVREGGADVNMQLQHGFYGSALAAAAHIGRNGVVEFLVREGGADINMQLQHGFYGSALAAAVYRGRDEVIEFLVREGGADVNMQLQHGRYGSALATATYWGKTEVVEFLVREGGADVNMQLQHGLYGSALAAAAYMWSKEVVEFLVREGGADVNMQLQHGEYGSALAAAVYIGRKEAVEFLVREGGADVNMQVQHGLYGSALAAAVNMWRIEVAEFLVREGGADVNMQLQHGEYGSALAATAYRGRNEVVEFLVREGGADVNMQLQHGRYGSALAAAAYRGSKEVVEFLVKEGGADVNMQMQHGIYGSALDAAEDSWRREEMMEQLISYGARRGDSRCRMDKEDASDCYTVDSHSSTDQVAEA